MKRLQKKEMKSIKGATRRVRRAGVMLRRRPPVS